MIQQMARHMATLEECALTNLPQSPEVHHYFEDGEPHDVLRAQAAQVKADLISVGSHGRVGLARTILGSVSTEILNDRMADVLVVRAY